MELPEIVPNMPPEAVPPWIERLGGHAAAEVVWTASHWATAVVSFQAGILAVLTLFMIGQFILTGLNKRKNG